MKIILITQRQQVPIDNIYVSNTFLIKIIKSVKTAVLLFNIINNGIVTVTGISILIYIISSN